MSMWEFEALGHKAILLVEAAPIPSTEKLNYLFYIFSLIGGYDVSYIAFRESEILMKHHYLARIDPEHLPQGYGIYQSDNNVSPDMLKDGEWYVVRSKIVSNPNHFIYINKSESYYEENDITPLSPGLYTDRHYSPSWKALIEDGLLSKDYSIAIPDWSRLEAIANLMVLMENQAATNKEAKVLLTMLYGFMYYELWNQEVMDGVIKDRSRLAQLQDSKVLAESIAFFAKNLRDSWEYERFPPLPPASPSLFSAGEIENLNNYFQGSSNDTYDPFESDSEEEREIWHWWSRAAVKALSGNSF